jgi:peptidoglycan/LPS O-acetylase OafA/YrhL
MPTAQSPARAAFAEFWKSKYFPALDGLRALAVLLVMVNHIHFQSAVPPYIQGWVGVDVFFVLSGFLITTLLVREHERYGDLSFKGFYVRRAFRILPVYWFTTLLYIAVVWGGHMQEKQAELRRMLPYLVLMVAEFRPLTLNVFSHAWTLCIEEKFYLLWPPLLTFMVPFRKWSVLLLIGIAGIIPLLARRQPEAYAGLFFGSLLGLGLSKQTPWPFKAWAARIPIPVTALLALGGYCLIFENHNRVSIFTATLVPFIGTLVLRQSFIRTALASRVLTTIGRRSYAMYLIHVLVCNFAERMIWNRVSVKPWVVMLLTDYLLTFLGASVIYVLLERPMIERGRKISSRWRHVRRPNEALELAQELH